MHTLPSASRHQAEAREATFWERPAADWAIGFWTAVVLAVTLLLAAKGLRPGESPARLLWFYGTWLSAVLYWWQARRQARI